MKSSSPSYAVVIPSNRVFDSIKPLLVSLINQTQPPKQLIIVWDRYATQSELDTYAISVKLLFAQLPQTKVTIVHHLSDSDFSV